MRKNSGRRTQHSLLVGALCPVLFALYCSASAQQPTRIPRIGFLGGASSSSSAARRDALSQGLRELGYVDGKNIFIEWRSAEGDTNRLASLAAELVRLKVDVIVTGAPSNTRAAKEASSTIPIVMAFDTDPVGNGFVATLARPGGNITGLSALHPELNGKQVELMKEVLPSLSHLAVLGTIRRTNATQEMELAADALKLKFQYFAVKELNGIEAAFQEARKARADAAVVLASPILESARAQVAGFATKNRLPAIYHVPEFVEAGGLMSYGASFIELYRRSATYVDKILKGAKPAELPVQQPSKFELVINLKTAKQIGLAIPPNLVARADKVIR